MALLLKRWNDFSRSSVAHGWTGTSGTGSHIVVEIALNCPLSSPRPCHWPLPPACGRCVFKTKTSPTLEQWTRHWRVLNPVRCIAGCLAGHLALNEGRPQQRRDGQMKRSATASVTGSNSATTIKYLGFIFYQPFEPTPWPKSGCAKGPSLICHVCATTASYKVIRSLQLDFEKRKQWTFMYMN